MQSGGQTQYSIAGFPGYVGAISAMKPGVVSITLNTRMMPQPLLQMFDIYIDAITEKGYSLITFLSRSVAANATSYADALQTLSTTQLIADVYYIVASAQPNGGGCVLARNQTGVVNSSCLNPPEQTFTLVTNYPWWLPQPWYDNRLDPAIDMLKAMQGQYSLSKIYSLLGTQPVFNQMTVMTVLMTANNGTMQVFQRWCNEPCPF